MTLNIILLLIVFVSITQEKSDDRGAGLIFCIPIFMLKVFESGMSGWYYYLVDATLSCATILLILRLFKTRLSLALSKSLIISILINFVGFNMWFFYQDPTVYYVSFVLYYSFVLYLLFAKGSSMWTTCYRGWLQSWASLLLYFARMPK